MNCHYQSGQKFIPSRLKTNKHQTRLKLWHKFCGCEVSLYKVRRFEERKKPFCGSFSDKIALNRQLFRLKDFYYRKRLGQENRQLHKPTRQLKLKAIIRPK